MSSVLLSAMQQAAVQAVKAGKPMQILFGTVTSLNPLTVESDAKLVIPAEMLRLSGAVSDRAVDIEIQTETMDEEFSSQHSHTFTGEGDVLKNEFPTQHRHRLSGCKRIILYNGLKAGEAVVLLKQEGKNGKYTILDRVHEALTEGEWL